MDHLLTAQDRARLLRLATRDEDGRHFMEANDTDWLSRMEEAGAIRVIRPVHEPSGIAYSQEYWDVEVLVELEDAADDDILAALLARDEGTDWDDPVTVALKWQAAGFDAAAVGRWLDARIGDAHHAVALATAGYRPDTLPAFDGWATLEQVCELVERAAD